MVERSLARLAGVVSRRRRAVFAVWLVLLAAGGWFSLHQNDFLSGGGWEVPGSPSLRVADAVQQAFPSATTPVFTVFIQGGDVRRRVADVRRIVGGLPQVRPGAPLYRSGAALVPVTYTGKTSNAIDEATTLRHHLVDQTTKVIGEPAIWSNFQTVSKHQLARGEELGFPLILLILLAGFGTVVAAVAPMALGFAAVFLSGAVIYGLSRSFEISVYVTNMASMVGIGVAVDYSLFIVSRFRRELHEGATRDQALARALRSSGTAVVFSGAAVVVSLGALFAIDVNALRSMAVGAIVVVCISLLASITLVPAMLAAVGTRVDRLRLPLPWRTTESGSDAFWSGWARRVMRRPVTGFAVGAGVMLVLAIPFFWMQTFNRGLDELPSNAEVRVATEQAQRLVGAGFGAPVHVLTTDPSVAKRIVHIPGVAHVAPPVRSSGGSQWLIDATLSMPVESNAARDVVDRIQTAAPDATLGGTTVFDRDVTNAIFGGLWKMLLVMLAACYVVLLLLLRSVVLPVKAVLMNLLSVGAAYGVLVAVFQWGWLDWTGYHSPGYVETVVPPLVLAVTFGLSMDYEVFLLTRIRERWLEHGDNERAVAEGLVRSARIITSAALVMVAVFFAFVIAGAPALKELGAGLGVAILLDATIVRLLIVPAAMRLLGAWNWWIPQPLARLALRFG
ncbi:MAG TPA: MMPL family transporter [Gaiellaceae bacterium]|jgi:RND superfamily putative drug exporter